MGVTEKLAQFMVDTSYGDFPEKTLSYAKRLALSSLGTTLWASAWPASKIVSKLVREMGGTPEAGVVGAGFKTSAVNAALANGTIGHAAEWESSSFPDGGSAMALFPVVFALGEKLRLSGRDVLQGTIVGHEVQSRIGLACAPFSRERGYLNLSLFGSLGAAAAAAKLLGLDVERSRMALGIAASHTGGYSRQASTMTHYLETGLSCSEGLMAAMLAKEGFTADKDILEDADYPGFGTHIAGEGRYDTEKVLKDLGNPFRIEAIAMKGHPCCNFQHRILDGTLQLINEHNISCDEVERVEAEVSPSTPQFVDRPDPAGGEEARFSIYHGVAAALLERRIGASTFTDEKALDPVFREAGRKLKLVVHPEWERGVFTGVNIVTIKLKDGREFSTTVEKPKGDPGVPFTTEELIARFEGCAEGILAGEQVNRAIELILDLENLKDVSELMEILTCA
ncbi:MAG: MmgE/PrpD family protein [Chloroflexi bacterium]|nr:MmgE/PrpD family protein [Chloroflexota bacterium]